MAQPGPDADADAVADDSQSPSASPFPPSPSDPHQSNEPNVLAPESSSSASGKRQRDALDAQQGQGLMLPPAKRRTPQTRASSATSISFPSSVRRRIHDQPDSDHCWNGSASPVDMCHVIGKKEREVYYHLSPALPWAFTLESSADSSQVAQLERDGFLPPDFLQSFENSITLCPLCHRNFDDLNRPGFIFLPDDLGYFIAAAKADLQERQKILDEENRVQRRRIPSQEDYHMHCATRAGIASESLDGGYYKRYALRDYYQNGVTLAHGENPYRDKKTWPGNPFATIRRGFYALGIKAGDLPAEIKADLRQLSDLYDEKLKPRLRPTSRAAETTSAPSNSGAGAEEDGHNPRREGRDRPPTNQGEQGGSHSEAGHGPADPGNREGDHYDAITSQASTLVDAAIKFDRLPTFKRGPNDHVVRMHDYNCRNLLPTDHACRACVIEKYDNLGIMYEPTLDDWPTTCEASDMYPGVLPLEVPPRWRYGPKATAQEQVEKKMRSRYGEGWEKEGGQQTIR